MGNTDQRLKCENISIKYYISPVINYRKAMASLSDILTRGRNHTSLIAIFDDIIDASGKDNAKK